METRDTITHIVSLGVTLLALWFLLSGMLYPLFILFAILSIALVVWVAARMDLADREGHPIHLWWRVFIYWPWLTKQMLLSCIDVTRRVLSRDLDISPCVFEVRTGQASALGRTIYANSITLTPGTVAMSVDGDRITVHALSQSTRDALLDGEMNERASRFEGE